MISWLLWMDWSAYYRGEKLLHGATRIFGSGTGPPAQRAQQPPNRNNSVLTKALDQFQMQLVDCKYIALKDNYILPGSGST